MTRRYSRRYNAGRTGRTLFAIVVIFLLSLGLAGCDEGKYASIEDRVENKTSCEEAGGTYVELFNDLTGAYRDWICDLSTEETD